MRVKCASPNDLLELLAGAPPGSELVAVSREVGGAFEEVLAEAARFSKVKLIVDEAVARYTNVARLCNSGVRVYTVPGQHAKLVAIYFGGRLSTLAVGSANLTGRALRQHEFILVFESPRGVVASCAERLLQRLYERACPACP